MFMSRRKRAAEMALEDHIQKVGTNRIEITNMTAFGAELTKALSELFNIKGNYKIPILTEEEYAELEPDRCMYCLIRFTSCFDEDLKSVMLVNTDKHNPCVYGEELTHGLVCNARPGTDLSVDEFFGFLGQKATYKILRNYQPQLHLPSLNDIIDWFNRSKCKYERDEIYKIDLDRTTGGLVAGIAAPVALEDKKLFSRSDEEIKHIYFEPVLNCDWPKYWEGKPDWWRLGEKCAEINREIKKRMQEAS